LPGQAALEERRPGGARSHVGVVMWCSRGPRGAGPGKVLVRRSWSAARVEHPALGAPPFLEHHAPASESWRSFEVDAVAELWMSDVESVRYPIGQEGCLARAGSRGGIDLRVVAEVGVRIPLQDRDRVAFVELP